MFIYILKLACKNKIFLQANQVFNILYYNIIIFFLLIFNPFLGLSQLQTVTQTELLKTKMQLQIL